MRPVAIIQARMASTRLPGKVLRPIIGHPMLWHVARRLKWVTEIREVVVATSDQSSDEPIRVFCRENQMACFAGSEQDVLDRFYQAALEHSADPVLRITADCPFVDPEIVSHLLKTYQAGQYDHFGVATGAGAIFEKNGRFPDGLDAECIRFSALTRAWKEAVETTDREHVTPYLWRVPGRFRAGSLKNEGRDLSHIRWTVDTEEDFRLVTLVYEALYREDRPFLMEDILSFVSTHPDLGEINRHWIGKENYVSLWQRAESK
jgi:spore coat polysaccharide biosynthesis protein SpsF